MDGQKKESIKYCARKCHNGGPLTKMMVNHRKKFWERTIAILSSGWHGQPGSAHSQHGQPSVQPNQPTVPVHSPLPPEPGSLPSGLPPDQPPQPSLPTQPQLRLPPAKLYVKHFINLGAHIMSPTILKLLLTAMTLVTVAAEEGRNATFVL